MTIVNITNHGRITIPSEIRKKYGWKDGDKVIVVDHPLEGIKLLPCLQDQKLESIMDLKTGIDIVKAISKDRELEIEREKDKLYRELGS